jgi:sporulation protein YlmC with PRC-barrel domain
MKRLASAVCALSLAALIPAGALAQTSSPGTRPSDRPGSDRTGTDRPGGTTTEQKSSDRAKKDRTAFNNTQGLHETGDIIGARVEGPDGKNVGKVEALLIDPKEGKVSHAVVGMGGMLGVGEEKVVVPYTALKMTGHEGGRKGRIAIDQSALDSAPKYVKTSERAPSASPATTPRSGTTSGSSGLSGDPRTDTKRDGDTRPLSDRPAEKK